MGDKSPLDGSQNDQIRVPPPLWWTGNFRAAMAGGRLPQRTVGLPCGFPSVAAGATWSLGRHQWQQGSPSAWRWENKIILEMVNYSARPPAAPGGGVLITVGSQEEDEQMRSGAKLVEKALKTRTGVLFE